ncbi:MAG: hypothetical protein KBA55_09935 [Ruminococcus sp.]|nr:hypothetical protein [Ruminococcus sp.]
MKNRKMIALTSALMLMAVPFTGCGETSQPAVETSVQTSVGDESTAETTEETASSETTEADTAAAETAETQAADVEVQFPDLSAFGIDPTTFRLSDEPYFLDVDDNDYGLDFIKYINDAGDEFVFYPDGKFYSYERDYVDEAEDSGLTDEEFNELAYNAVKAAVPDIDGFTASAEEDHIWRYTKAGVCEDTGELAMIRLNEDGSLLWLGVNRNSIADASVVDALKEKAKTAAENRWKDKADFNYVNIEYPVEFFTVGGKNYGIFNYVISEGDPEAFGCYDVLVGED